MSVDPEDLNGDSESEVDDSHSARLTDLEIARHRSNLTASEGRKSGDITDQLARIKLPGEPGLTARPAEADDQAPETSSSLRAVRDLGSGDGAPPPPSDSARPTEQLQSASDELAASREAAEMAHAETHQELLSMMDRISAGLKEGPSAAPPPPAAGKPVPPSAPPSSSSEPSVQPPERPAAAEADQRPPAEPAEPKPEPFSRMPQGLVKYWMSLTKGRKYPSWGDFESAKIAEYWPNSMILTCGQPDRRGDVTISKVTRIADQNVTPSTSGTNRVEYTPMLTEWILSLGKEAARSGKPMQETDRFPTNEGIVRYQMILLPLSDEQSGIDHVLCHVYRA